MISAVYSRSLLLALCALATSVPARAANFWVDWTGAPASYPVPLPSNPGLFYATTATGTLVDPITSSTINVTYAGEVLQYSQFNNPAGNDLFNFSAYQAPNVTTLPPRGDYIALSGYSGATNTLTFSQPVTNLLMSVASLGGNATAGTYNFVAHSPVITSSGAGFFGNGPMSMQTPTIVYGEEGNGMLQFNGTFSSLSWTAPTPELYSAFNVGIVDTAAPSPTPAPLPILGAAAAFRLSRRLRRRVQLSRTR